MKIEQLLLLSIVVVISSLAGGQNLSYAEEPNQTELWFKAIQALQNKINDNNRYIELCEARIAKKRILLEKAKMQNHPTSDLELEISGLERERAIRIDSGTRWKSELDSVQ